MYVSSRLVALLAASVLFAQNPPQAPPAADPKPVADSKPVADPKPTEGDRPAADKGPAYVRRISAGVTVLASPMQLMKDGETKQSFTALDIDNKTDITKRYMYFGAFVQAAVTEKFAAVVSGRLRPVKFVATTTTFEGFDRPNTIQDERRITTKVNDTRAKFWDFTFMLRRYGKDRHEEGNRWFAEIGPSFRKVRNIKSSTETTLGGNKTCCDTAPHPVANKLAKGMSAGVGAQFTDEFGIKLVPEVRYTRWFGRSFDLLTARTRADQVDIALSFTF